MIEKMKEEFWSKWNEESEESKLQWIRDNTPGLLIGFMDVDYLRILGGLDSLVASLCGKYPGGDFIEALLSNDLIRTLEYADDINEVSLKVYMFFIYDKVPTALRRK